MSRFVIVLMLIFFKIESWGFQLQKVIGDNDLLVVSADAGNLQERLRPLVDAFGKMTNGCTATHLGGGYVITAGHCFWAGDNVTENEDCADTAIEWGYREGLQPYLVSQCEKVIAAQQNGTNDFALLKVSPIPTAAIPPDLDRMAAIGDTITIFSHPEEMTLRWSGLCGIEREQHPDLPQGAFHHKCDTNPGSSGASVINYLSLKVVGIHNGGTSTDGGMNYGTKIMVTPLYDYLKNVGF